MRRSIKVIFAAVAAIMVLSLAAGPASARNRVEVSTTAALLSGRLTFESSIARNICDVTLHITLRRLIQKLRGASAGWITATLTANARNNLGLEAGCDPLDPMEIFYGSIRGTLPTITGGELLTASAFLVRIGSTECLYRGEVRTDSVENPIRVARVSAEPRVLEVRVLRDEFFRRCPEQGELIGEVNSTPAVTVRLLE